MNIWATLLPSVTDWNSNATSYGYDDVNRMTTATLPNGVVSTSSYDNANRLTGITRVFGGTTLASASYTVDAVGNRSDRTDLAGTQTYAYDSLYRLTSVTYPGPTTGRVTAEEPTSLMVAGGHDGAAHRSIPAAGRCGMGREQFLGAWRLVSYELTAQDGSVRYPFGESPIGLAVFTADGYASAQLMRGGRQRFRTDSLRDGTPEEMAGAFAGYVAYFGKCDVDEATRTLVTHVEGSLFPNWMGGDQVRNYEFRDGKLILMPQALLVQGEAVTGSLTWERVE